MADTTIPDTDDLDRQPPRSIEAEQCVLGSIMLDNELVGDVLEILDTEDFYLKRHRIIFDVMKNLYDDSRSIDQVTLSEALQEEGKLDDVGGPDTVVELADVVPSPATCMEYAEIVRGKAILRRLVHVCNGLSQDALSGNKDPDELIEEAERQIFQVARASETQESMSVGDLLQETIEKVERSREEDGMATGISTGLTDLDDLIGGLRKGSFTVIAGRPGMGKTSLARTLASNIALNEEVPTAIYSLEMTAEEITLNMLLGEAGVPPYKVKKGYLSEEDMKDITEAAGKFEDAPLFIDHSSAVTSQQLRARVRRMKSRENIEVVFVDYLQLMEGSGAGGGPNNRQEQIAMISRAMKGIARELNIAVVALSQLNRKVEQRQKAKPKLADLRESGAIEQDADIVTLLYREYYYTGNEESKGITEAIIAKHRNGPTDTVELHFDEDTMQFKDLRKTGESLGGIN